MEQYAGLIGVTVTIVIAIVAAAVKITRQIATLPGQIADAIHEHQDKCINWGPVDKAQARLAAPHPPPSAPERPG